MRLSVLLSKILISCGFLINHYRPCLTFITLLVFFAAHRLLSGWSSSTTLTQWIFYLTLSRANHKIIMSLGADNCYKDCLKNLAALPEDI